MIEAPATEGFLLLSPTAREVPIVVEIPHAGTDVPDEFAREVAVCGDEVLRDADSFVDAIWRDAPTQGAATLVAGVSRYVVDLNRDDDDVDALAVSGGRLAPSQPRGVVWRESGAGRCVLPAPLSREAFERRLARCYRPYHGALEGLLRTLRARYGRVLLVAAHSMPSCSRLGSTARRAAVVPGTLGRTTADCALIDVVDAHFRAAGLSVRHDQPYRGGATTARWGKPAQGFHAIQIELNRSIYMDEAALRLREDASSWLRDVCTALIPKLAAVLDDRSGSANAR